MSQISERQKTILDKIIREYIKQAVPVSSGALEKKYNLGLSSASVRLELHRLTESGYLEQPYISAGRLPTDKGYRFFVDEILERERISFPKKEILKKLVLLEEEVTDPLKFFADLTKFLADFSSNLALTFLQEEMLFFREGWLKVLKEPEFENLNCTQAFVKMLKELEEDIENFLNGKELKETRTFREQDSFLRYSKKVKVFIGSESRISGGQDFSLILGPLKFKKRRKGLLALLGPKRMDYSKNIGLISSFVNFLEKC